MSTFNGIAALIAASSLISSAAFGASNYQNVVISGKINGGQDALGLFGPKGANLEGMPFSETITYNPGLFLENYGCFDIWEATATGSMTSSITIGGNTFTVAASVQNGIYCPNEEQFVDATWGSATIASGEVAEEPVVYGTVGTTTYSFLTDYIGTVPNVYWVDLTQPVPNTQMTISIGSGGAADNLTGIIASNVILSPFLASKRLNDIDIRSLLSGTTNFPSDLQNMSATGLAADGVSAAIAVFEFNNSADVTLTASNGTVLLPYAPGFLTKVPEIGGSSLTISAANLIVVGSLFYAVALVQAPPSGVTPAYATPIVITAQQQGGKLLQASLPLVPPPVLLVHGLWSDDTALSSLQNYLSAQAPWNANPNFVVSLCYSKNLKFNAKSDPLTNGQPCEITANDALETMVTQTLSTLNAEGIVVGKVDVVAHSMGGLAARFHASQTDYHALQNRGEGQFHTVVTLDTPETGSLLASFLLANRNMKLKRPGDLIWDYFCGIGSKGPIGKCFNTQGDPVSTPGLPLSEGAVYSLIPSGPSLSQKGLASPNIPGVLWLAASAVAPTNSATEYVLNDLISEITPKSSPPQTINSILGTVSNDAIVSTDSQTSTAMTGQNLILQNLSHSSLLSQSTLSQLLLANLNDNSVVSDSSGTVNQLVACWLATIGSAICAPANAETMEKTQQSLVLDSKKESDFPIEIKAAGDAILGEPIRLPLSFPKGEVPIQIAIEQRELEGHNHCDAQTVPVEMKSGDYPFITFVPCGLGETRLQIMSVSSDRTRIGLGNITLFIRPPKAAPITFKADRFSQTYIDLDKNEPFAVVDAVATFAGIPGKFSVPHEFLDFSIEQSSPPGAITVTKLGLLQGIKEGVATLTVRFGTVGDTVKVFARHRSTDDPFQVKP